MKYLNSRDCPAWMNGVNVALFGAMSVFIWHHPPTHESMACFAFSVWGVYMNINYGLLKVAEK